MSKMVQCKTCGASVASNAKACPNCGAKVKKVSVVGIIVLVLIGIVLISVIASSGDEEKKPKKETNEGVSLVENSVITEEQAKEETYVVGDTAVFEKIKVTANTKKVSSGTDFFKPESGNTFVGVEFTIENISDEDVNISSILLFDAYVDDTKCDYSISAECAMDSSNHTLDGSIAPGKKMTGWYAVEVPQSWAEIELQIVQDWLSGSKNAAKFVITQ